jgi:hypothetical protein
VDARDKRGHDESELKPLVSIKRHTTAHRDGLAGHVGVVDQHHHGGRDWKKDPVW